LPINAFAISGANFFSDRLPPRRATRSSSLAFKTGAAASGSFPVDRGG
jgi:hypothetical protein